MGVGGFEGGRCCLGVVRTSLFLRVNSVHMRPCPHSETHLPTPIPPAPLAATPRLHGQRCAPQRRTSLALMPPTPSLAATSRAAWEGHLHGSSTPARARGFTAWIPALTMHPPCRYHPRGPSIVACPWHPIQLLRHQPRRRTRLCPRHPQSCRHRHGRRPAAQENLSREISARLSYP